MSKKLIVFLLFIVFVTAIISSLIAATVISKNTVSAKKELNELNRDTTSHVLGDQNTRLKTYKNYRFGFEVDYPTNWILGRSPDNGDGIQLYSDQIGNEVTVYGSHMPYSFSTQDAPAERELFKLDNGITATSLKIVDEEEMIRYLVFFEKNGKQYVFYARSTEAFHNKHRNVFDSVARSFRLVNAAD